MANWCSGSGTRVPLRGFNAEFPAPAECPSCHQKISVREILFSGWGYLVDHGDGPKDYVPGAPNMSGELPVPAVVTAMAPATGRAAAIWDEFIEVAAWARTYQEYSVGACNHAARIIVGINSIPELSLLTVIETARRASSASTFRQDIAGLLPSSIPGDSYTGTGEIVLAYYQKVGGRS